MTSNELADRFAIRELIEAWAIWRDSGQWERLATTFHSEGVMVATWKTAAAAEFIAGAKAAWERGVSALHVLSGSQIDIEGDRAIAQTRMAIHQRASLEGVRIDVTCRGRFYDFLQRREGRWGIVIRQLIYEQDRLDTVDGEPLPALDRERLQRYPQGYQHLAYVQSLMGFDVRTDLPGTTGSDVETLYARAAAWLSTGASPLPN